MNGRRFADLPAGQRALLIGAGAVQIGLFVAAQIDLARRPAEQIRGSKAKWRLASLVNFVGPLCYFWRGRRRY